MWDRLVRMRFRKRWKPLTLWPSTLRRTPPAPSPDDVGVAPGNIKENKKNYLKKKKNGIYAWYS